jgi:predicted N-acyltransferase
MDAARRLQGYTCEKHGSRAHHLTEGFFEGLERHLNQQAELSLYFKDDTPILSSLLFHSAEAAHSDFPGMAPNHREYHAYPLSTYHEIETAISLGVKRIYLGTTTYEFKEKIGCRRIPMFALCRMASPLLDAGMRWLTRYLRRRFALPSAEDAIS